MSVDSRRLQGFVAGIWRTPLRVFLQLASFMLPSSRRRAEFNRLFAHAHYREVAGGLPALKQDALARLITSEEYEIRSPLDPRFLRTTAGLTVGYTVRLLETCWYEHHLSVSCSGGPTPRAVGEGFTLFVTRLLGVDWMRLNLGVSETFVHHSSFVLGEQEQAAFIQAEIQPPTIDAIEAFRKEWFEARTRLQWVAYDLYRSTDQNS